MDCPWLIHFPICTKCWNVSLDIFNVIKVKIPEINQNPKTPNTTTRKKSNLFENKIVKTSMQKSLYYSIVETKDFKW